MNAVRIIYIAFMLAVVIAASAGSREIHDEDFSDGLRIIEKEDQYLLPVERPPDNPHLSGYFAPGHSYEDYLPQGFHTGIDNYGYGLQYGYSYGASDYFTYDNNFDY